MTDTPPPFFAMHVLRALRSKGVLDEIGVQGCYLVAFLAGSWDDIRYGRPMAWRIESLMEAIQCPGRGTFYKIERRCIDAGWIIKTNRATRQAPLYEVAIPESVKNCLPGLVPELVPEPLHNCSKGLVPESESGTNRGTNLGTNHGTPSMPLPVPKPEDPPTPQPPRNGTDEFADSLTSKSKSPQDLTALTDDQIVDLFRAYVHVSRGTPEQRDENRRDLIAAVKTYGREALLAAEKLAHEHGEKSWPNEVADAVLAERAERAEADRIQAMRNRPKPPPPHQWYERAMAIAKDLTPRQLADILHTGVVRGPQWYDMVLEQDGHARNLIAWHERQTGKGTAA